MVFIKPHESWLELDGSDSSLLQRVMRIVRGEQDQKKKINLKVKSSLDQTDAN